MGQLDVLQYGYLGLVALALMVVGHTVVTYIKTPNPAKYSIFLISAFFLLSCSLILVGYIWAEKELQSSEAKKSTVTIIQSEITNARERLQRTIEPLIKARDKALEQSVYGGNLDSTQENNRVRAKEITEMIELQEKRFNEELKNISVAFSSAQISQ
ncbi:hypothetical protein ACSZND_07595 [Aeromonas hydrophila]|uniref:hypothetical protein n=1 Tax=Aeromonas TaxID=642 RepID=UPI0022567038|nr:MULTISPECIES: hypothetical protein [Aeromonas]MCX4102718.1 hypothetical protein [Aeromonas hydrophila]